MHFRFALFALFMPLSAIQPGLLNAQPQSAPVEFAGDGWRFNFVKVQAVSRVSAKTGKTWVYLDIWRSEAACCRSLSFLVHAIINGEDKTFPISVPDALEGDHEGSIFKSSYNKELSPGPIQQLFLTLAGGQIVVTKKEPKPAYRGLVFADLPCFGDYLKASKLEGVAERKALADLVTTGCAKLTDKPLLVTQLEPQIYKGSKITRASIDWDDDPGGPSPTYCPKGFLM